MKKILYVCAMAALAVPAVSAQINDVTPEGYLMRGSRMYGDGNYNGCIDQLSHLDRAVLTDAQREQADWLMSEAAYHTVGADALTHFNAFLAEYPYSLLRQQALMRVGDCLYRRDYARALAAYERVDGARLTADEAETLTYRKAYCMLRLGEYDRADALMAELSSNTRYGNAARFYQGYIAYQRGDYDRALKLFATVNQSTEPGSMADYYLAQIYFVRGDYNKALSLARAVLRRAPEGLDPAFQLETERVIGESLSYLGNRSEALPYLERYAAGAEAPSASALYLLGTSEYDLGRYQQAVEHLQPVTQATATDAALVPSAYLYIGQAMIKLGDTDAALMAFDKASRDDADEQVKMAALYNYAVAKSRGGRIPFGSSVAAFQEFIRSYPESPYTAEVQRYIVTGYLTDNDYDKALEAVNAMEHPTDEVLAAKQHILYTLGARRMAAGDAAGAVELLSQARELARYDAATAAEVDLMLGEALYRTDRHLEAADMLSAYLARADRRSPNYAVGLYDMGYAAMALRNYDLAQTHFARLLELKPSVEVEADVCNRLGDIAYYASDFTRAGEYYDRAYAANPSTGDYSVFQKAVMRGYNRDHQGKIAEMARLEEEFPASSLIPDALLETTESYIQLGRNPEAIATYRRLIKGYPQTRQARQAYLQMAQTQLNSRMRGDAIESYRQLITQYPTSDEALLGAEILKSLYADEGRLDEYMEFIAGIEQAPQIDVAEADRLSFESAERLYLETVDNSLLVRYLQQYANGAYAPKAIHYLMLDDQQAGRLDSAAARAQQLIDRYPDNALTEDALAVRAAYDFDAGRGQAALTLWRELEQRASTPRNANMARIGIMRAAQDTGDYDTAIEAAEAVLASSTAGAEDKNEAIFIKGLALSNLDRHDEAREQWSRIASITDDIYGAKAAYYMAEDLFESGQTEQAEDAVLALTGSGTPHTYWLARAFILLSDICAAQGRNFEAREYLEALRDNYPGRDSDIILMIDSRLNK